MEGHSPTVPIFQRFGRNETSGVLRPNFGSGAVSQVRSPPPTPFETKRNFGAYWGCVGVCEGILAGRCRKKLVYAHVDADHAHAAEIATTRLIDGGHRRIALVNPHRSLSYARDRRDGFRAAFRKAGLPPSMDLVAEGELSNRFGMQNAERMSAVADPATAFVCVNESTALGVIAGLNRLGRRIGRDVSVIAFDDINVSGYFNPPLTTLYHPIEQQGRKLGEFLLRRIAGEAPENLVHVFRPELIVRQNDKYTKN